MRTIVVPTYNERENLRPLIERIAAISLHEYEILIVDDASPDGTGDLADALAREFPFVHVLHRAHKDGLGAAYVAGFRVALDHGADIIIQMDADGSHDPAEIQELVGGIERGEDLVVGSRRVHGGRVIGWGVHRRLASFAAQAFARRLLGLHTRDVTSGFRAWRADVLRQTLEGATPTRGYAFQEVMLSRAERAGARIDEHPITFRDRTRGTSKLGRNDVTEFFVSVLRLWWRDPNGDRRFVLAIGIALVLLTGLPYLYGWLRTPPDHVFTGIHAFAAGDMAVYGSYIEQVRDGHWLLDDLFTSEYPQRPRLDIFWLTAGLFARITRLPAAIAFHVLRLLLIIPFTFFLARFVAAFLERSPLREGFSRETLRNLRGNVARRTSDEQGRSVHGGPSPEHTNAFEEHARPQLRTVRRTALLLLAFSSGIGAYLAGALEPFARWAPGYEHWPMDLWVPESNTFLTLFQSPHLIVSLWLLLFIVLATLQIARHQNHRHSLYAGIAALVLFQFHPFYIPTIAMVLVVWTLMESLAIGRMHWDAVRHAIIVGALSLPSIVYHAWNTLTDPIMTSKAEQNLLFTPAWWLVLVSYGFLIPLAIIGFFSLLGKLRTSSTVAAPAIWRISPPVARLLLTWLATTLFLIFSPLTWQRRLTEGLHVVLVLIATIGVFALLAWFAPRIPIWVRTYAWNTTTAVVVAVPLFGFSTLFNIGRDVVLYTSRFPTTVPRNAFYYPRDAVAALHWLHEHTRLGETTLALGLDGNFLPVYATRQSAVGHGVETTDFAEKYRASLSFARGELSDENTRAFLTRTRVQFFFISDASRDLWSVDPLSFPNTRLAFVHGSARIYRVEYNEDSPHNRVR